MIREATRYDKKLIIDMLNEFRLESPVKEIQPEPNEEYFNQFLDNVFAGQGKCFLFDSSGLLLCVVLPTLWNNKVYALHELAWYVRPKYRGGSIGYRLFKRYIEYGKQLKEEKRVKYFTISKMISSPNLNYEKYGFIKLDENFIQ